MPGKAELLDLMLDRVQAELGGTYSRDAGWRRAAEQYFRDLWAFHERHAWVLQIHYPRSVLGPHELDADEAQLALLDGIGLTASEVVKAVAALEGFVSGSAILVAEARAAQQATGKSDDDWWTERSPLLDEVVTADVWAQRFPVASKLSEEQAFDEVDRPDDSTPYLVQAAIDGFEFGLARLLDGIEAMLASR